MCALKPQYVTSTDNTAVFAIEGIIKDGQNEWKRVSSSAAKHSERASRSSIFTTEEIEDSVICNGLLIKLTFTFSAAGTMAPLVMRITRLSESELPVSTCPDSFLVVAVPGFCVGGSVDPQANSTGYIVFTRKSSASSVSIDRMFLNWYESTVYKQFIEDQRHIYDGCQPDAAVSDSNTVASWFDGEMTQLSACTQAARLDENLKHKIRDCKHSASRTAEEQGCDCAQCLATGQDNTQRPISTNKTGDHQHPARLQA